MWVLFGEITKDAPVDAVIHDAIGRNCEGSLQLLDTPVAGQRMTVRRYQKHSTHRNALILEMPHKKTPLHFEIRKTGQRAAVPPADRVGPTVSPRPPDLRDARAHGNRRRGVPAGRDDLFPDRAGPAGVRAESRAVAHAG